MAPVAVRTSHTPTTTKSADSCKARLVAPTRHENGRPFRCRSRRRREAAASCVSPPTRAGLRLVPELTHGLPHATKVGGEAVRTDHLPVAGTRKVDRHIGHDPTGPRAHDQYPIREEDRLENVVRDEHRREPLGCPDTQELQVHLLPG